jgi:16S rRNA processing protein RimM
MEKKLKRIARLKGPFSLSGEVRLQFIDIELAQHLIKNKAVFYAGGDTITLTPQSCRAVPKGIAFRFSEVSDRTAAEALPVGDVNIEQHYIPEPTSDDYSLSDLVGMVLIKDEKPIAHIIDANNYGASDVMECKTYGTENHEKDLIFSAPMIDDIIKNIDFEKKQIIVTELIEKFIKI